MSEQQDERQAEFQIAQTVRRLNDEWVTAFVQRDTATLRRIMADDCVFTYPLEGDDQAQFIADIESGDLTAEQMTRDHVGVRVYGQTAVLTCRDTARWRYHGRIIEGQYSTIHVYAERGGRWQVVTIQACPITH
ncbi:MAG TPA: nuclear transport factor 2 family protein [Pyrinomonadaceae bacterium]|jgi:ketosteroid isomerase-like protein